MRFWPGEQTKLDRLIVDYNRKFHDVQFVGNTVVYKRDTWNELRDAFRRIIAECSGKQEG
jgi:hypothetical protein